MERGALALQEMRCEWDVWFKWSEKWFLGILEMKQKLQSRGFLIAVKRKGGVGEVA